MALSACCRINPSFREISRANRLDGETCVGWSCLAHLAQPCLEVPIGWAARQRLQLQKYVFDQLLMSCVFTYIEVKVQTKTLAATDGELRSRLEQATHGQNPTG